MMMIMMMMHSKCITSARAALCTLGAVPQAQAAPCAARSLLLAGERAREPVESLVEPVPCGGAGRLDEPLPVPEVVEPQLVGDLRGGHGVREVLLVGEDEEHRVAHLLLVQHLRKLFARVLDAVPVVAVNNEDEALRVLVVVAPKGTDLVLAAHVPDREADVLVLHGLHVETDRRDRRHHLSELELIKDGRLPGGIKADHEDAHLLLAEHPLPYLRECEPHGHQAAGSAGRWRWAASPDCWGASLRPNAGALT